MDSTNKLAEKIKELALKKGKDMSDAEAQHSAHSLVNLFKILVEMDKKHRLLQRRQKSEPEGFPLDGQYSCLVCGRSIDISNGWHTQHGQACFPCRDAVKSGVIPTYVFVNRDSYFCSWALDSKFGIKHQSIKKYIREGKLVARVIAHPDGKPYDYLFLKKENPSLVDRYAPSKKSYERHKIKRAKQMERNAKIGTKMG